ncbi:MAG: hypothetical protein CVV33_00220 [Methanomicrobiales archaeon HGW-Methanomicrobiales-4]|nr:MAG: hypothetical protein CVV33_00220 [Methanomicrobiales archaeon HGW-Methanomicrobiales-4]
MRQKESIMVSLKSWTNNLKIHRSIFFICIITICAFTIHATSLPMVTFPLKPSPEAGPYQDEEFLEEVNETIYGLSNQTIPNGTALRELQTKQQMLSKMSISPELYPTATQINAYLYYTTKAGTEYSDAMSFYTRPYSPVYEDESLIGEAQEYQAASKTIWNRIKDL